MLLKNIPSDLHYGITNKLDRSVIQDFFEFAVDRQVVWHKKTIQKLPPPWTEDPCLNKYRYCNIYRELDSGTIEILDVLNREDLSFEDKLLNVILYRFFNWSGFYSKVYGGEPYRVSTWNWQEQEKILDDWRNSGKSLFASAYLISSSKYSKDYRPREKHIQVIMIIERFLMPRISQFCEELRSSTSLAKAASLIERIPKVAGFLGQQILVDLTYIPGFFKNNHNINSYINVGPGAIYTTWKMMGLCSLDFWGHNATPVVQLIFLNQESFLTSVRDGIWDSVKFTYPYQNLISVSEDANLSNSENRPDLLRISDIQNICCEYRKYQFHEEGKGKKRRYDFERLKHT